MPSDVPEVPIQAAAYLSSVGKRILFNTIAHPFEYAKFLIQIGHEPLAPYPTRTFFGKPSYYLPNVFQYIKYIYSVDGFTGCYRGFTPKITSHLVAVYASQSTAKNFKSPILKDNVNINEDEVSDEYLRLYFIETLKKEVACKTAAIIASHPFHVIALRSMAQFVGGEEKYVGLFASLSEIYKEQGIIGFFSGIIPRLIGEISSLVIASTVTFALSSYVISDNDLKSFTAPAVQFIVNALTYPFTVVSSCMAVTDCGLAAGVPPNMPVYLSWSDCWSHLSRHSQLNRGSSLLWRVYFAPANSHSFIHGEPIRPIRSK